MLNALKVPPSKNGAASHLRFFSTSYELLNVERRGNVGLITLNRPKASSFERRLFHSSFATHDRKKGKTALASSISCEGSDVDYHGGDMCGQCKSLRAKIARLEEEKVQLQEHLGYVLQDVIPRAMSEKLSLENELKELKEKFWMLQFENGKLKKELAAHERRLSELDARIDEQDAKIAKLDARIEQFMGDSKTIVVAQLVACVQSKAARYLTTCPKPERAMFMKFPVIFRRTQGTAAVHDVAAKCIALEKCVQATPLMEDWAGMDEEAGTESFMNNLQSVLDTDFIAPWLPLAHPVLSDEEVQLAFDGADAATQALLDVCSWLEEQVQDGGIMRIPVPAAHTT